MVKLIEIKFLTTFQIMTNMKKIEKILKSIKKNINININISDQLDSIQFLDLISKLEQSFKIKISESEINVSNFKSIKNIQNIINEKKDKIKIIAEIGPNHNGDFNLAKKILRGLSKSKPDFVKFQLEIPIKFIHKTPCLPNTKKIKNSKIQ